MSSQPDRAADEPAEPADSPSPSESNETTVNEAAPSSAAEAPAEHPADAPRKAAAIRIGTQRYGVKPPTAVATPVLPAPPAELLAKAAAISLAGEHPGEPAQAEAGQPSQRAASEAPPAKKKPEPKPKALKPLSEPQPARKYPPPNIRSQLSAELEMELAAALGNESLEEMIAGGSASEAADELEPESRHKATVLSVHRDNVFVDLGGPHQGILPLKVFADPPEPGTRLDVAVQRFNAVEGLYELGLPGAAVDVGDWSEVAEGMLVEARVTGHNKGGLECDVNQLRGFIPASQISMYRVEDLAQFVGQAFTCVVTEANPTKRNLVLSRRAVLEREQAEAKEKLMAELEPGQVREATVRSLQSFGAFVDLGGVDGLIHVSQLSWDRVKHASDVLQVGQRVKVKVHKIDPQTGKISLALRDLTESPWASAARDFPVRSTVKGTVTRLMEFGAFVRVGPGVEGLVHISELSHKRVFRVSDVLAEGQEIEALVLSVDSEAQRMSLSLKALEAKAPPPERAPAEPEPPKAPPRKQKTPLRGGIGGPPSGDRFGLKW